MNTGKILLFGGSGFLGSAFINRDIISPSHIKLDLLDTEKVLRYITKNQPRGIIYCAGITKIDFAQKNKDITMSLNYLIPKQISELSAKMNIPFLYISSDAVFDGYKNKYLFSETDKVNPKSIYGISKAKGEESVLKYSTHSVIRLITLWDSAKSNNFVSFMLHNLNKQKEFMGIIDQIQNPLHRSVGVKAIRFVLDNKLRGIFHLGSLDILPNYVFLVKIANNKGLNSDLIVKTSFSKFMEGKIGHRKRKSVLLTTKFDKLSKGEILLTTNKSLESL